MMPLGIHLFLSSPELLYTNWQIAIDILLFSIFIIQFSFLIPSRCIIA